ncbi:MAG: TniQ family protein [Desulfosporosinus sp.]|nr:TniQ family protein [Desulfosporosinus sp.]
MWLSRVINLSRKSVKPRFTIRPLPKSGESLTGYLLRVVHMNFVDLNNLLTSVHNGSRRRTDHQIDILPERVIDLEALSGIVGVPLPQLRAMTFQSAVEKYVDQIDTSQDYPTAMRDMTDKTYRRFCPVCLQEDGVLKLIWQVKEVEICDKHHVRLTSKCPACGTEQPFLSKNIAVLRCVSCGSKLASHSVRKVEDTDLIVAQLRIYSDWRYLKDSSFSSLVPEIKNYTKEKSLAIAVLYLLQGKPEAYNPESIQPRLRKLTQGLVRMVRDDNDPKRVSVAQSLSILRRLNLEPSDLQSIYIPDSFIASLYTSKYSLGSCLAPWCKFCGTSNGMRRILRKFCFIENRTRYAYPSVCTGCYMRYGITDNQWRNVPMSFCDGIDLTQKVRKLLNAGASQTEITRKLKIRRPQLARVIGYLANHQLLDDSLVKNYTPLSVPDNVLECVKQIGPFVSEIGQAKAKKLYGWQKADFYYYMAMAEVQAYFSFDKESNIPIRCKSVKKRRVITKEEARKLGVIIEQWKMSDTKINFQSLAKTLNCPATLLYEKPYKNIIKAAQTEQQMLLLKKEKKGLRNKAKNFIDTKLEYGEPIVAYEVYANIGRRVNYLKRHFPWLRKWITLVAKKDHENRFKEKKTS